MKRIFCMIVALFVMLGITACEKKDEKIELYFGFIFDPNISSYAYEMSGGVKTEVDEEHIEKTMNNVLGLNTGTLYYSITVRKEGMDVRMITYKNDKCSVDVNADTGTIDFVKFYSKEFYCYSDHVDIDTAKERAIDFAKKVYGERVNFDEYIGYSHISAIDKTEYYFRWTQYVNDVSCNTVSITTDMCGNVRLCYFYERDKHKDEIPNYTDEQYIEMCTRKIEDAYKNAGIQAQITDVDIFEYDSEYYSEKSKKSYYCTNGGKYCVELGIVYKVVYPDGTIGKGREAMIYLPYA